MRHCSSARVESGWSPRKFEFGIPYYAQAKLAPGRESPDSKGIDKTYVSA
jgi:hypothetical protein